MDEIKAVLPCKCGHVVEAHGIVTESQGRWAYDSEENEIWIEEPYPRPVCWDCGPYDCIFTEMDNLEYLEWKCDNHKCS